MKLGEAVNNGVKSPVAKGAEEEVHRILQSPQFRRAPKLQAFLEVICRYYLQDRVPEINEFVIATEAFGKSSGFDPSQDSLVRVQAREVRRRLHEYYQGEGKNSLLVLDIPPGSYVPVFTPVVLTPVRSRPSVFKTAWFMLAATALACVALLVAADHERRLLLRTSAAATERLAPSAAAPVSALWNRFLDSEVATILVLSNPDVGPCTNPTGVCPDEYTGMGEAVAIHLITNLFKSAKQTLIVKQSRMVNADDVKRYNLIMVGGKQVNIWTRRLGEGLALRGGDPGGGAVFDTQIDDKTGKLIKDRALIAVRRNQETGHWMMFMWGHHSQGTHAAAEASTDAYFLSHLKWPASPFPDTFRVFVGVNVNDGIPAGPVPIGVYVP